MASSYKQEIKRVVTSGEFYRKHGKATYKAYISFVRVLWHVYANKDILNWAKTVSWSDLDRVNTRISMSEVMKAIRLTQLENELVDVRRQIKKIEGIINSPNCSYKHKRDSRKLLPALAKKRDELIDEITESSLLHETDSNLV